MNWISLFDALRTLFAEDLRYLRWTFKIRLDFFYLEKFQAFERELVKRVKSIKWNVQELEFFVRLKSFIRKSFEKV